MKTGESFIDYWTLAHLSFWIFIASSMWAAKISWKITLLSCISIALSWELFERFAEKRWPEIWQEPESVINAYGSDILTVPIAILIWWTLRKGDRK